MSLLDDLIASTTAKEFRDRVLSVAGSVGLKVTSWIVGEPSEQWLQVVGRMFYDLHVIIKDSNRAHFLELATDPGDEDDEDPAAGWLSAKGLSDYGPERTEETFATGFVTLTNGGANTHTVRPEALTLQNSGTGKTYRNEDDNGVYAFGYFTLGPGTSQTLPVRAEEVGTASNAAAGEIDTLVSSLSGVTVTNASPVLGTDREPRPDYIARCRLAASATSPNGPAQAYEYIALNTNADGTLGTPDDGKTKVNITRVQVTKDSAIGTVVVWLASPSGPATGPDVAAVLANIQVYAVPDCVTLSVLPAVAVNITVSGTLTGNAASGLVAGTVEDAADAATIELFATAPVGGFDGIFYDEKIAAVAIQSHASLYKYVASSPVGDTALADGEVAVLVGPTFSVVLQ